MGQARNGASQRMQILHRFDKCFSGGSAKRPQTQMPSATAAQEAKGAASRPTFNVVPMPRRAPEPPKSAPPERRVERHMLDERAWVRENGY